nr:DNA polymerase III subunit gamma/tau [Kangiella sp. HZ709]
MSYQVLARKWRPKNFKELQGQEHVSRALINAIETERLHHAYLFTGTRGVGKTTIARILAKCLNCETHGLTASPCGECGSCVEIDEGRFVDLIEVDAASRTKVDDTRELLDNVQYRPTRGRYKVYLIDEVHMLSNSSFNALLKTLEEPPEHVIFLLATTDPQKLPVTVLSRCLQFHLKHMDEEIISKHLEYILSQESISFEAMALGLIAQSAEGSMRDALSLLDQAIAFSDGKVNESDIRNMLGTIDHRFMDKLLNALAKKDSKLAIDAVAEMSNFPIDFADALKELLSRLHQIAIFQATQVLLDSAANYLQKYAELISPQDLQLYYQMGLHAKKDLAWAATPKQGLEMALLRMLAFQIAAPGQASTEMVSAKKK